MKDGCCRHVNFANLQCSLQLPCHQPRSVHLGRRPLTRHQAPCNGSPAAGACGRVHKRGAAVSKRRPRPAFRITIKPNKSA